MTCVLYTVADVIVAAAAAVVVTVAALAVTCVSGGREGGMQRTDVECVVK